MGKSQTQYATSLSLSLRIPHYSTSRSSSVNWVFISTSVPPPTVVSSASVTSRDINCCLCGVPGPLATWVREEWKELHRPLEGDAITQNFLFPIAHAQLIHVETEHVEASVAEFLELRVQCEACQ